MITDNNVTSKLESNAPLGIVANIAAASQAESPQERKFRLQNAAARLLPDEKVSQCLRHRAPATGFGDEEILYPWVEVHQPTEESAHYKNLILCDRVWGCPVCASRIAEQRRQVLSRAIDKSGYRVALATFTLSHTRYDSLLELLDAIKDAYRRVKSGRWWQQFKADFGLVGDIKAIEVTYGDNGWHPHIHVLMLFPGDIENEDIAEIERALKIRWIAALAANDQIADYEHGFTLQLDAAAEYIAKYGDEEPQPEPETWTASHELAHGHSKTASRRGKTPFALLNDYDQGDAIAGALFREYYAAFKGTHQLQWSRGLKELLRVDEIEAEIEAEIEETDNMVMQIWPSDWAKILYHKKRGYILHLVIEYGARIAQSYIESLGEIPDDRTRAEPHHSQKRHRTCVNG